MKIPDHGPNIDDIPMPDDGVSPGCQECPKICNLRLGIHAARVVVDTLAEIGTSKSTKIAFATEKEVSIIVDGEDLTYPGTSDGLNQMRLDIARILDGVHEDTLAPLEAALRRLSKDCPGVITLKVSLPDENIVIELCGSPLVVAKIDSNNFPIVRRTPPESDVSISTEATGS